VFWLTTEWSEIRTFRPGCTVDFAGDAIFDGADGDDIVPRCLLQERVELAGVGDNALAGERAKERDEHLFEVGPLREGLRSGSNLETEGPVLRWPSYGKRPQEVRHARAADHAPRRRQGHDERLQLRAPDQQGLPRRR